MEIICITEGVSVVPDQQQVLNPSSLRRRRKTPLEPPLYLDSWVCVSCRVNNDSPASSDVVLMFLLFQMSYIESSGFLHLLQQGQPVEVFRLQLLLSLRQSCHELTILMSLLVHFRERRLSDSPSVLLPLATVILHLIFSLLQSWYQLTILMFMPCCPASSGGARSPADPLLFSG